MDRGERNELMAVRLRKLERANRRLWFLVSLIGIAFVLSVALPQDSVRARRFILVDENGEYRGVLSAREEFARLILQTPDDQFGAELRVGQDYAYLTLRTPDSSVVVTTRDDRLGMSIVNEGSIRRPIMEPEGGAPQGR